jgi:hypothetical protein
MKKNALIKGILILLAITLLSIGFTGCGTVISTTGTVNISAVSDIVYGKILPIDYIYDIHMDGIYMDTTNNSGNLTIVNVPVGWHTFEAFSTFGSEYGSKGKYISTGVNNLTIPVSPFII